MTRSMRATLASLALPITLAFSGCGDGLDLTPNLSGPIAGSVSGGGVATATPTPAPAAATPTPTPTPVPSATCGLSSRPDCGGVCCHEHGSNDFVGVINNAQSAVERSNPEIFNSNGSLRVGEVEYTTLLAAMITSQNGGSICAVGGGGGSSRSKDEIGVKRDNGRSINVDVINGSSNAPHIGGIYECLPAAF